MIHVLIHRKRKEPEAEETQYWLSIPQYDSHTLENVTSELPGTAETFSDQICELYTSFCFCCMYMLNNKQVSQKDKANQFH